MPYIQVLKKITPFSQRPSLSHRLASLSMGCAVIGLSTTVLAQIPAPSPAPSSSFANSLFSWAERTYPQVFPTGPSNWIIPPYILRSYLGIIWVLRMTGCISQGR